MENRTEIIKTVGRVYGNNFNLKLYNQIMNSVKAAYVSVTNQKDDDILIKNIQGLYIYLDLFKHMTTYNKKALINDPYMLKQGFNMKSINSGITLAPILYFPKKGYTMVFSFRWQPDLKNVIDKYSIITLVSEKPLNKQDDYVKDYILLSIYVENKKLYISLKEKWDTEFIIEPDTSYLISIVQIEPGFFSRNKSKISVVINKSIVKQCEIVGYPQGKMICQMGYHSIWDDQSNRPIDGNHFRGQIGCLMIFNEILTLEVIEAMSELKGNYEDIVFRTYESYRYYSETQERVMTFFKQYDRFKFEQKLSIIISPRV